MERFKVYCSNKDCNGYTAILGCDKYVVEQDEQIGQYAIYIYSKDDELSKLLGYDSFKHLGSIFCDTYKICEWVDGEAWSKVLEEASI